MEVIAMNMNPNISLVDKIAGSVFGFAIGDAMGATTEFMTDKQIRRTYGKVTNIIGKGWLDLNPGEVTDDTEMTMCVMDALMKYPDNQEKFLKACGDNFIEWFKSGPKDIGNQCLKGIERIMSGEHVSWNRDRDALGNGSLMRAMPCALLNKDKFNILQGSLTHRNRDCSSFIQIYTSLIQTYLSDKSNVKNIVRAEKLLNPSGHVKNTLNNSIYWTENSETFKDAIINAVNHGGDADTIAAITGSLAGAKYGFSNIPKKWIDQLNPDVKIFLKKFIKFTKNYLQN
jgi:ADP-ribosyl-[dinitrogen reductase] hydrolase